MQRGRISSAPNACGLFFKRIWQRLAIAGLALALSGCVGFIDAELNNRGGYLDQKFDSYWMIADTKQMRVLRGYMLIGSISRLPIESKFASERKSISDQINTAVQVANSAFVCAYSIPGDCVYFDERMAELEMAVLRLAILVFTTKENEGLFSAITKAFDDNPAVIAVKTTGKIVDVAATGAEFLAASGKLVVSLLNFSEAAYSTGKRAGALYRDSLELGMIATLKSLEHQCVIYRYESADPIDKQTLANPYDRGDKKLEQSRNTARNFYGDYTRSNWWHHLSKACDLAITGTRHYERGSGELTLWKQFLTEDVAAFRSLIVPNEAAFIQASDLIWRGCKQIAADDLMFSQCLGARRQHLGGSKENPECGCKSKTSTLFDCPYLKESVAANVNESGKSNAAEEIRATTLKEAFKDKCPLLLYAKTWNHQQRRYGNSMTRLYWLSANYDVLVSE